MFLHTFKQVTHELQADEEYICFLERVITAMTANEKSLVEALITSEQNAVVALQAKDAKIAALEAEVAASAGNAEDPAFNQQITDATAALTNATTPTA